MQQHVCNRKRNEYLVNQNSLRGGALLLGSYAGANSIQVKIMLTLFK